MNAGDWIQTSVAVVLTLTLAAVLWYACEARKQAEATRQQTQRTAELAEETRTSRLDSLRPILEIRPVEVLDSHVLLKQGLLAKEGRLPPSLNCSVRNIGPGPALNVLLRTWRPDLEEPGSFELGAIAAGENVGTRELHLEPADQAGKGLLRVAYEDLYGRRFLSYRELQAVPEEGTFHVGPLRVQEIEESRDL